MKMRKELHEDSYRKTEESKTSSIPRKIFIKTKKWLKENEIYY